MTRLPLGRLLLLLALLLPLPACDYQDSEPVEGSSVDLARLFAAPTAAEVAAARASLDGRDVSARDVALVDSVDLADGSRVYVVSHTMDGVAASAFTHYGAVRVPAAGLAGAALPVLVVHHGGDNGFGLADASGPGLFAQAGAFGQTSVQVFPTYRGEPLRVDATTTLTSGDGPSPWDRDVDDAIGLLNAALQAFPAATDEDRIGAIGISRGATVALLMALRDERVDVVSEFFGFTDYLSPRTRQLATALLLGTPEQQQQVLQLPGVAYLNDAVLQPLARGEVSYEFARRELVKRSPAYYVADLPPTQAFHHRLDAVVPFEQFELLQARADAFTAATEFNAYGEAGGEVGGQYHSFLPTVMPDALERLAAFQTGALVGGGRYAVAAGF